jgi:hypothetical protein
MKPLALAPLALLLVHADRPQYAPTSGAALKKTFTETTEVTLDSAVMTMNGQDREEDLQLQLVNTRTVEVRDSYDRAADGKVTKLTRSYDDIAGTIAFEVDQNGETQTGEFAGTAGLAGHSVTFELAADGELTKAWADEHEGEAAWLDGLTLDMDLADWLPTDDVAVGDGWAIPVEALRGVLTPGNVPRCQMENVGGEDESEALLFGTFFSVREICDNADGDFDATWKGTEEVDGQKFATLALEFDVAFERDVLDVMAEIGEAIGESDAESMTRAVVTGALDGEGVLVWNLTTGLPESLVLEGEVAIELSIDVEQDGGGGVMDMHMQLEMSGTTALGLRTETP